MEPQQKTATNGELAELPQVFFEHDFGYCCQRSSRHMRATVANLYVLHNFSWYHVRRDPRAPHRDTMLNLENEAEFVAVLEKLRPIIAARSRETLTKLMQESQSDAVKMKTAQFFLESYEPETYDPGVRRQMRANQGTWINSLLQASLPDSLTRTAGSLDPAGTVPALDAPLSDNCPISDLIGQSDPMPFPDEIAVDTDISQQNSKSAESLDILPEKPQPAAGNPPAGQGAEPFADGTDAAHPTHTFSKKTKNRKKP